MTLVNEPYFSATSKRTSSSTKRDKTVHFFVRFETWNLETNRAEPLPKNTRVELVDWNPILADEVIDAQPIGEDGRVHFSEDFAEVHKGELYFVVHLFGLGSVGQRVPRRWSTKGWKSQDGQDGYYPDFTGSDLGTASKPIVFRVGMDFHARIQYQHKTGDMWLAPKGVRVAVVCGDQVRNERAYGEASQGYRPADPNLNPTMLCRTDKKGEIHGVFYGAQPGLCSFEVVFEIEDPSINLPKAMVATPAYSFEFPHNDKTTLGSPTAPLDLQCMEPDACAALYILKTLRELSVFLFYVTGGADEREDVRKGAWKGVKGLTYHLRTHVSFVEGEPYSWPVGSVWMTTKPNRQWSRGAIIHETAHQVMWKEVDWSSLGIAYQASFGKLHMRHDVDILSNPMHTLIEGWAEFVEFFFGGSTPLVSTLYDPDGKKLPVPFNAQPQSPGERVEGVFASALVDLAVRDPATGKVDITGGIPETKDGDVSKTAPKIADRSFGDRFRQTIWYPLKALRFAPERTTTELVTQIAQWNEADWPKIHKRLLASRIGEPPKVTGVSRRNGPSTSNTWLTITGKGFAHGAIVRFGGRLATKVYVRSEGLIEVMPPPDFPPGPVDVEVATPYRGTGRLAGGYTFP